MKKLLAYFTVISLAFGLPGCGNNHGKYEFESESGTTDKH